VIIIRVQAGQPESPAEMDLLLAASVGNQDAARRLLNSGSDVNAMDKAGETPLSRAARNGHEAVV
jgi:ankyrin repeat protein